MPVASPGGTLQSRPDNMDRVVLDLRKQLDYLDKSYTALLATSKKFSLKAGSIAGESGSPLGDVLTERILQMIPRSKPPIRTAKKWWRRSQT